jgi:hypothetical protein
MSTRGAFVQVTGVNELHRALKPLLMPEIELRMYAALKEGAKVYAKALRAEARPASRTMSRAVRYYKAKRDKPGYVVGFRRKRAFFTHFVIGGTRDHGPRKADALVFIPGFNPYLGASSKGVGNKVVRTKRVRGVKANPIVDRAGRRAEAPAAKATESKFVQETGL